MNLAKRFVVSVVFGSLFGLLSPLYVYYACFHFEKMRKHATVRLAISEAYKPKSGRLDVVADVM